MEEPTSVVFCHLWFTAEFVHWVFLVLRAVLCCPSRSGQSLLFESLLPDQSTSDDNNVKAEQTRSVGLQARGEKKRLEWEMIFF